MSRCRERAAVRKSKNKGEWEGREKKGQKERRKNSKIKKGVEFHWSEAPRIGKSERQKVQ